MKGPRKKPEEKLESITIRIDLAQKKVFRLRAQQEGVSVSRVIREAAMRDLTGDKGWMRRQKT